MCAVEDHSATSGGVVDDLSLDSSLSGGDEGSSSLSSIAEEDISDLEARAISKSRSSSRRVKLMCSYGGRILPRPHDHQLRYTGGETRILVVKKDIAYKDLMAKLSHIAQRKVVLKYQLLNEDLDALISVTSDEDVKNMMEEYDKMVNRSRDGGGSVKLRVFLFPKQPAGEVLEYSSDDSGVSHPGSSASAASKQFCGNSGSKFSNGSPPLFAAPLNGPKLAKLHTMRGRDEFGSLRSYQQQQQQQQKQSDFSTELDHQKHGPGMFYQVHSSGGGHHHHHHHDTSFNGNDSYQGSRSPCRCCTDPSLLLPPRHPFQQRSYHQHHPAAPKNGGHWNGYEDNNHHYYCHYQPQPQYHRHAERWM